MPWTEEDIRRIEGKFDSFCKTVLRNFARDWYRAKQRRGKNEVLFSELPDNHSLEPIHIDPISPAEKYFFDDLEGSIAIENDALAQALHSLSGRKRQIILLAYFRDWTDQQIGERFHVVRSTIQAARTKALKEMRDLGNTLIVVEHDEDTIRSADYVVDIGKGAGIHGGNLVYEGNVDGLLKCEDSITGAYLSSRKRIEIPSKRRKGNGH